MSEPDNIVPMGAGPVTPPNTTKVLYTCGLCDLPQQEVRVKAREEGEGIIHWIDEVMVPTIIKHHRLKRPNCHPRKLKEVKIALPKGEDPELGGATE